jgi:hypothetical protein
MSEAETKPIFEDITELLREAAKQLNDSTPMAASEQFSLYDSMSAVEIMDPKMDPCCGVVGQNFDDLISNRLISVGSLTFPSLLQLFQELFVREVAYLDGASLLESVNQCIFVWPQSWKYLSENKTKEEGEEVGHLVPSQVLMCYMKSVVASLDEIHQTVITADIFEDEDYQASSLLSALFDETSREELKQAISTLLQDTHSDTDCGLSEIKLLLRYRVKYLELMAKIQILVRECIRNSKRNSPESSELTALGVSLEAIKSLADEVLLLLNDLLQISSSSSSAAPTSLEVPPSTIIEKSFTIDILKINQNTPARYFPFLSYHESLGYVHAMVTQFIVFANDLQNIFLLSSQDLDQDYLLTYFQHISSLSARFPSGPGTCSSMKGMVSVVTRSFLWGVTHSIRPLMPRLVLNSMTSRGIPRHLTELELCGQWREIVGNILWDTYRNLCVHRYRLTSRLEHLFERYGSMVADGFMLDRAAESSSSLATSPKEEKVEWFIAWAIHLTSGIMDQYMGLLVEMDLLSFSELACFHWYWDYLISTRAWAVRTMREMKDTQQLLQYRHDQKLAEELIDQYEFQTQQQQHKKGGAKNKKGKQAVAAPVSGGELIDKAAMKEAKKILQQRL